VHCRADTPPGLRHCQTLLALQQSGEPPRISHSIEIQTHHMMRLSPLLAILLAGILQAILRGGATASTRAPNSLLRLARVAVGLGMFITVIPLFPLALDLPGSGSPAEALSVAVFLLLSLLLMLPLWRWLFVALRNDPARSTVAFVLSSAVACSALAVPNYMGLWSGVADSQDGIVVLIVPVLQIVVTLAGALLQRVLDNGARTNVNMGHDTDSPGVTR
jgi:hypothetical protein